MPDIFDNLFNKFGKIIKKATDESIKTLVDARSEVWDKLLSFDAIGSEHLRPRNFYSLKLCFSSSDYEKKFKSDKDLFEKLGLLKKDIVSYDVYNYSSFVNGKYNQNVVIQLVTLVPISRDLINKYTSDNNMTSSNYRRLSFEK